MSDRVHDKRDAFTDVEHAVIRHAVQDWAGTYHSTIGDPARYVTEGHLDALTAAHGLRAVWDAVAHYVHTHPRVLQLPVSGPEGREARQAARMGRARQLMADAKAAFDAGEHGRALDLVDYAELAEPTYEPSVGVNFDRVRDIIRQRAGL
jgi:hypothetical protein